MEKKLEAARSNLHLINYKWISRKLTDGFPPKTMEVSMQWDTVFKGLKEKKINHEFCVDQKSLISESKINIFPNKPKLRKIVANQLTYVK